MYKCKKHGWTHQFLMCPYCTSDSTTYTTTSGPSKESLPEFTTPILTTPALTRREYLVGQVAAGLLAGSFKPSPHSSVSEVGILCANYIVTIADALIKKLEE